VAKEIFYKSKIMFEQFDLVDWEMVSCTSQNPKDVFQIWAMKQKQVINIAPAKRQSAVGKNFMPRPSAPVRGWPTRVPASIFLENSGRKALSQNSKISLSLHGQILGLPISRF
jgi:hypothetical protein